MSEAAIPEAVEPITVGASRRLAILQAIEVFITEVVLKTANLGPARTAMLKQTMLALLPFLDAKLSSESASSREQAFYAVLGINDMQVPTMGELRELYGDAAQVGDVAVLTEAHKKLYRARMDELRALNEEDAVLTGNELEEFTEMLGRIKEMQVQAASEAVPDADIKVATPIDPAVMPFLSGHGLERERDEEAVRDAYRFFHKIQHAEAIFIKPWFFWRESPTSEPRAAYVYATMPEQPYARDAAQRIHERAKDLIPSFAPDLAHDPFGFLLMPDNNVSRIHMNSEHQRRRVDLVDYQKTIWRLGLAPEQVDEGSPSFATYVAAKSNGVLVAGDTEETLEAGTIGTVHLDDNGQPLQDVSNTPIEGAMTPDDFAAEFQSPGFQPNVLPFP